MKKRTESGDDRAASAPGGEAGQGARRLVLLVEDNDADRDVYGGLLWYNGFDVVHAADGASAIATALSSRPDLILLDLRLPGELDGLAVARRIRREGLRVPIVVLSALSRAEAGEAAAAAGASAYLEKPIDPFAVVKEVIRRIGYARPGGDASS